MPKNQESKKTQQKKQNKVIEDKTFGLKNKNKSKAVQKYVTNVAQQVKNGGVSNQKVLDEKFVQAKEKKRLEEEQKLLQEIYQSVEVRRPTKEGDASGPTVKICPFFRQGLCQKGKKCKLSHDLTQDLRNTEEIDLYTDQRSQMQDNDTIDKWDENKLKEVVSQQEKKYKSQVPTEIVCRFFLDAVENAKYGWKWICPNGMNCHYRHCLPPGFVFKKKKKELNEEEQEDQIAIEEKIEEEKRKLDYKKGTPVTLERFLEWKKKKQAEKQKQIEKQQRQQAKQGKAKGMSGRALFDFNQELFIDDDAAADDQELNNREDEEEEENTQGYQQETILEQKYEDEDYYHQNESIQQQNNDDQEEEDNKEEIKEDVKEEEEEKKEKKQKKKKKKNKEDENGVKIDEDAFEDL